MKVTHPLAYKSGKCSNTLAYEINKCASMRLLMKVLNALANESAKPSNLQKCQTL
jgi:hypothetical protein